MPRPRRIELRRKAEARLRAEEASREQAPRNEVDVRAALHELQVHQIELEMQNEELQLAQAAAEEASEKYQELFDFAPVGYFLWDHEGRIVQVNMAGAALLGLNRGEVIAKRFAQFVSMEDRTRFAHFRKQVMATDSKCACEVKLLGNGRPTYVTIEGIASRDAENRKELCRAAVIDVTDRKLAEVALRDYQAELETAVHQRTEVLSGLNRALQEEIVERQEAELALRQSEKLRAEAETMAATGRLAAKVAHEINNPLGGIKNYLRLVGQAIPQEHPDWKYVRRMDQEIDRIAGIVEHLFILHRPRQEVTCDVDIAETVKCVIGMLAPKAERYQVSVEPSFRGKRIIAKLPEGAMRQVLYNLIGNAIEASPPAAEVRVEVGVNGSGCRVDVVDRGPGIPPEIREVIFQPFFTTKRDRSVPGIGMGLSVCKGIIDSLGGTLTFETELGAGTTFRATVPPRPPEPL